MRECACQRRGIALLMMDSLGNVGVIAAGLVIWL